MLGTKAYAILFMQMTWLSSATASTSLEFGSYARTWPDAFAHFRKCLELACNVICNALTKYASIDFAFSQVGRKIFR